MKILSQKFFEQPALKIAKVLLGKYLVRRIGRKTIKVMITEVEAYDGFKDKASHAARGLTERNKIMFGPAGYWYVYFTYGMHWMLNIVTGREGYPAAVLIRGVRLILPRTSSGGSLRGDAQVLASLRDTRKGTSEKYINGPARLTKFLKIDKRFNNKAASCRTGLWIEDNPRFRNLSARGRSAFGGENAIMRLREFINSFKHSERRRRVKRS